MDNAHFDQYIALYIKTGKEYIDSMIEAIDVLLKNPVDKKQMEHLYIGAHNIKSQSLVMGFENLGNLSHEIEKIVKKHVEDSSPLSQNQLNVLRKIIDKIESVISNAEFESKNGDFSDELKTLETINN